MVQFNIQYGKTLVQTDFDPEHSKMILHKFYKKSKGPTEERGVIRRAGLVMSMHTVR
jgi:hypothetical protein